MLGAKRSSRKYDSGGKLQLAISRNREHQRTAAMRPQDFRELFRELNEQLDLGRTIAVLGFTSLADKLLACLTVDQRRNSIDAIYDAKIKNDGHSHLGVPLRPLEHLQRYRPDVLVVAHDARKEDLLSAATPYIAGTPKIIITGYAHFAFESRIYDEVSASLQVPSLANGYPNSSIHLFQCLENASRLGLTGVVVELGMFRGGTTMLLSRLIERLGSRWHVLGFDTFGGFPPRRSPLDMYEHPDLCSNDVTSVRQYLQDRDVEIVQGDIFETCKRLIDQDLVLTFFDTDNYSPAKAALDIVRDRTVIGGAIVFDHFAGVDRFKYTLGERMAAKVLLQDARYFHLHGTGVFYRQR